MLGENDVEKFAMSKVCFVNLSLLFILISNNKILK